MRMNVFVTLFVIVGAGWEYVDMRLGAATWCHQILQMKCVQVYARAHFSYFMYIESIYGNVLDAK